MKVIKLQEGGGMPFVVYQPTPSNTTQPQQQSTQTSKSSQKEEDSKTSLLSKEVMNELIKNGLPNDVNSFLKDLQSVEQSDFGSDFDRTRFYSLTAKANSVIHNAKQLDSAVNEAFKNDGMEELAVNSMGGMYVKDRSGKIKTVSTQEYQKKKDSLMALTVSDLVRARSYDSSLSFDSSIISTVQNSVGINKISDFIVGFIDKLGTESVTKDGYVDREKLKSQVQSMTSGRTPTEKELKGIQELANTYNELGKDGIYKITSEKSSQRNHITEAFEYLWTMLPNNARNVLKARYVVDGNEAANPANIIQNALLAHTNQSSKTSIDYQEAMSKKSKDESAEKQYNQSAAEKLIYGDLDFRNDIELYNKDDANYGLKLKGSVMSQLPTLDNKPISSTILSDALDKSAGSVVDKTKMYFGNKQIQTYDLNNIIYDGGQVANVWVPVNNDGSPNFSLLKNYNAATEYIKKHNITDPSQMNSVMRNDFGLPFIQFDSSGKLSEISKNNLKPFLVLHGYSTNGIEAGKNNTLSNSLEGTAKEGTKKMMEAIYNEHKIAFPSAGIFSSNQIVQAPIFLALSPSATNDIAHFSGKGSLLNQKTVAQDMLNEQQDNNIYSSSSLLYNK